MEKTLIRGGQRVVTTLVLLEDLVRGLSARFFVRIQCLMAALTYHPLCRSFY